MVWQAVVQQDRNRVYRDQASNAARRRVEDLADIERCRKALCNLMQRRQEVVCRFEVVASPGPGHGANALVGQTFEISGRRRDQREHRYPGGGVTDDGRGLRVIRQTHDEDDDRRYEGRNQGDLGFGEQSGAHDRGQKKHHENR